MPIEISHCLSSGASPFMQPSKDIRVLEFLRKRFFDKNTDLDRLRASVAGSDTYVEERLKRLHKMGSFISPWRTTGHRELVDLCKTAVRKLFRLKPLLSYQLHLCTLKGQHYGIGLFVNRDIVVTELAEFIRDNESTNCEVIWFKRPGREHDSVYTARWEELGFFAQMGWWWNYRVVEGGKKKKEPTWNEPVKLEARFAIYGHIMFANYHPRAPFLFNAVGPITPLQNQERIKATITLGVQHDDRDLVFKKG